MKSMSRLFLFVFVVFPTVKIFAQGPPPPPPPPGLPVDSGLVLLLVGAVTYGVKKLRH